MKLSSQEHSTQSKAQAKTKAFVPPAPVIQKKLKIGSPDDPLEAEADAVADKIVGQMEFAPPPPSNNIPLVQRKCSNCEEEELQKKPIAQTITPVVQRRALNTEPSGSVSESISTQINASRGGGNKMDAGTLSAMESGFGTDFSNVRIHTDSNAIQLSKSMHAQAFTVGNDIYFNEGKYNTSSTTGKHLLAHELAHTIQQGGAEIKKMDEETEEAYYEELEYLDEIITEAEEAEDYETRNYYARVVLILETHEDSINNMDDFNNYLAIAEMNASDEYDTLDYLGQDAMYDNPMGFPETWADEIYDLLYLNDPDIGSLRSIYEGFYEVAEEESEEIPDAIIERGFPVYYDDLGKLKRFEFHTAHASLGIEHPIKDFTIAMIKYGRSKWRDIFVHSWNLGVESTTEAIRNGEYVVDIGQYQDFMDKDHDELVAELPERAKELFSDSAFEHFSDDLVSLQESYLIAGLAGTFGTLLGIMFFVGEADTLFEEKRAIADTTFNGLEGEDKVIAAVKWAYYNGYYGKAGEKIWQQIQQHGWLILGAVFAMIIALIAGHVFPPLGIALDALLLVLGGVDLLIALDELVNRVKAAGKANSLETLQKESGKLADVIVKDGLQIILELAGFLAGKAISKSFSKIKGEATDMSTANAMARAIESTDEGMDVLEQARKTAAAGSAKRVDDLDMNTPSAAGTKAVGKSLSKGAQQARDLGWPDPPGDGYFWVYRKSGKPYLSRTSKVEKKYFDEASMTFKNGERPVASTAHLPDVSSNYEFTTETLSNGTTIKMAKGKLGVPGQVRKHRSRSSQRDVSSGTGDDAGHLIGDRFGAPGTQENLSRQNWKANQGGGTFHDLENTWDNLLQEGWEVEVKVSDYTRKGSDRPYTRKVEWTAKGPNGESIEVKNVEYVNFETAKSRDAAGHVPEEVDGDVVDMNDHR
ncbi:MAG: DUF4157 domain-containing protein [Flavobacteriaceae bacterium]|nr:DUF4157 domain-containing protein [Flavobacteriaceae bacterium]